MTLRPTYASVASTLALVLALGGTGAYAAGLAKNSVGSKQIKNSAVKSVDVKDGSLTGADIAESTLGKVPSAAGVDTVRHLVAQPPFNATTLLLTRGSLTLRAGCGGSPGTATASLLLSTSQDNARWVSLNGGDQDFDSLDGYAGIVTATGTMARQSLSAVSASGVSLEVTGFVVSSGESCRVDVVVVG